MKSFPIPIFMTFVLLVISCNKPSDQLLGYYRLNSGGGYVVIMRLGSDSDITYVLWNDLGGGWSGHKGIYHISGAKLTTSVYFPFSLNKHYIRSEEFEMIQNENILALIPAENKVIDKNNLEKFIQRGCFVKFATLDSYSLDSLQVTWSVLQNNLSIGVPFPPPPDKPILDDYEIDTTEITLDSLITN